MTEQVLHATAVALAGRGLLITGASGRGKSDLALGLMALGADLIADDQVRLRAEGGHLMADAPDGLPPLIEARCIGLLNATLAGPTRVMLVIDLDREEPDRMPPQRQFTALGCHVPLIWRPAGVNLPAALCQFMRAGRSIP